YGRDFSGGRVVDLAEAAAGHPCVECGAPLRTVRGIEVGNIFKLGTKYSKSMGAEFLDADGQRRPVVMGCYGIGVGRLMAAAVEQRHDAKGILWPESLAPFDIHLVALNVEDAAVAEAANRFYEALRARGKEVLFDDRSESAGV